MLLLALTVAYLLPSGYLMNWDTPTRIHNIGNTLPTTNVGSLDSADISDDSESGDPGSSASDSDLSDSREAANGDIPYSHQDSVNGSIPASSFPSFYFPPDINCAPIALEESEFTYVDESGVLFRGEVVAVIFWTETGRPVICSNFEQNGTLSINITTNSTTLQLVFPKGFAIASYIGCSLSVAGSFFLLLTYSLFKDLRTLPGLLLMSLSLSFLIGDLLILLGSSIASISLAQSTRAPCIAVAILLHYFFLARFCWTNVIAFEMLRTFTAALKLLPALSNQSKKILFVIYSLIGWGVPLVIVLLSVIVNFTTEDLIGYGVETCWINDVYSAVIVFVAPLTLSLLFNLLSFILIITNICKSSVNMQSKTGKKNQFKIRLYVAVFSVMGLTWIFGFIAILARSIWAWYPFIILNSTQALVVSLSFTCTKKIVGYYIELLCSGVPLKSSVSGNKSIASNKISPTMAAT